MEEIRPNITRPKDVPMAFYAFLRFRLTRKSSQFLRDFFFGITPDLPYNLGKRINEKSYSDPIKYGILIGLILCLILPIIFCFLDNTFHPSQCTLQNGECDSVIFFTRDIVNIIMYSIITPIMFGFGFAMLQATFRTWYEFEDFITHKRSSLFNWKGFIIIVLIIVASSVIISNYINDIVSINSETGKVANKLHFWFLGDPVKQGVLRPVTVYYAILNFLILVFHLACVAVFVTAIRPIIKLSDSLLGIDLSIKEVRSKIIERLSSFADVYLFVKLLLAVAMLHSIIWSYSPLAFTQNFNLERGFLAVVSIFFIAIPRLHFELEWYRVATVLREEDIIIDLKPDYRRRSNHFIVWFADFLVVGSYLVSISGVLNWGPYVV